MILPTTAIHPDRDIRAGPTTTTTPSDHLHPRNVLIVGDVGAGKSSLVNLVSGRPVACTSSGVKSCTLHSEGYPVTFDDLELVLYDTAGLHEAQANMDKSEYLDTIYQAHALISRLEQSGGVSLLVFCMKASRVTITMQQTYNLFVDVLCRRRVPVVIVVTHLEEYDRMEQWWEENEKYIQEYGLRSHGHACITTTRGLWQIYSDKYDASREVMRKVLVDYSGRSVWKDEKASWVTRVMLHMRKWLAPGREPRFDGSRLRRKLVKRCGLSVQDAEAIVRRIDQSREMSQDIPGDNKSLDEIDGPMASGHRVYQTQGFGQQVIAKPLDGRGRFEQETADKEEQAGPGADDEVASGYQTVQRNHTEDELPTGPRDLSHVQSNVSLIGHATIPSARLRAGCEEDSLVKEGKTPPLPLTGSIRHRTNVVLFGETGAGKSSLVNLILDKDVARTSSGASACTLDSRYYDVTIEGRGFRVYDTVGLNESRSLDDPDCLINAINKAYRLIRWLTDSGGVNLLVFCVRSGRTTTNMQNNYTLFHEFLCQKKVPITLVITHLEQEEDMEKWWTDNEPHFSKSGIHAAGHACTTTLRKFNDRYHASRQAVHTLLLTHGLEVGFTQEEVSWVAEMFQKLLDFLGLHPRYDSVKVRSQRLREYGLKEEEITALLKKITSVDEDMKLGRSFPPRDFRVRNKKKKKTDRVLHGRRSNTACAWIHRVTWRCDVDDNI